MIGIPYSEHSSFFELTCFALSVPGPDVKMIATVNVGNEKRSVGFTHNLRSVFRLLIRDNRAASAAEGR